MEMKGFYFSMDAMMGLMVIGLGAGLISSTTQISQGVSADEVRFNQYSAQAIDISYLMQEEDFSAINKSYRDDLVGDTVLERHQANNIARSILVLHQNSEPEASELAGNYLDTFDYSAGLYIEGDEVVGVNANETGSSSFMVPGKNESKRFTVVVGK